MLQSLVTQFLSFIYLAAAPAFAQAPPVSEPVAPNPAVELRQDDQVVTATLETATTATTPTVVVEPLATTNTLRLLRTIETYHKDVETIHATFHQLSVDEIFEEKVESLGELWFHKPSNRFRADYADPRPMITLITPEALYVYIEELEQVDVWEFRSPAEQQQQLHQLLIGFGFEAEDLVERYKIQSSEDEGEALAELKDAGLDPAEKALFLFEPRAAYKEETPFNRMKVTIDKASLLPEKIWYIDPSDTSKTLTMKKIDLDQPLPDTLFNRSQIFPAGVEYIDKRSEQ